MNVQQRDVAVVINGRWPNIGRIVVVLRKFDDVDYRHLGYGVEPSWWVRSMGGLLDTTTGPAMEGHAPDIALRKLYKISSDEIEAMRLQKAYEEFNAALAELAVLAREYEAREADIGASKVAPGATTDAQFHVRERSAADSFFAPGSSVAPPSSGKVMVKHR